MFRLIGFLTGVAVTVVALAAVVDAPTRERAKVLATAFAARTLDLAERISSEGGGRDSQVVTGTPDLGARDPVVHHPAPSEDTEATTVASTQPVSDPRARIPGDERVDRAPQPDTSLSSAAERSTGAAPDRAVPPERRFDATAAGPAWEPVWRAFRSELSAKGFAGHLERVTGQAYRVRRTSPWTYQVELRYRDAAERDSLLREIESRTGLGLVGESP